MSGVLTTYGLVRLARRATVTDRLRSVTSRRPLPEWLARPVARALHDAALDVSVEQGLQVWVLGGAVAVLIGFAIDPAFAVALAAVTVVSGPVGLRLARRRRERLVAAAVPDALERVASELRAGGTVATAVTAIGSSDSPLASELRRVEVRAQLGASQGDALSQWARESRAAGAGAAAGALALCATVGGRGADALDGLASSLRARLAVAAEARALSAQARYSAIVMSALPVLYVVSSAFVDAGTLHALIGTSYGRVCAIAGAAFEAFGVWWMRRIVMSAEPA